jgi:hypothetical protein
MAIPKIGEPAAVEVGPERQCKIANSREKENRSLNNVIAHIGDAIIRHVKNKQ